ncbi:MAG TPA: AAA family ATPase [Anaerolineales bacterium]|nr:AAA family ATPase [Anaerolineales bacterium]
MADTTQQPQHVLNYAAHLLRRLTDSTANDPTAADLSRLQGPLLDVVMSVLSEGRDKSKRKSRLQAELTARGLDLILSPMIDLANPNADLATLETSKGWEAFDLADVMVEEIPPISWVVRYFLPRPSVVVFFGKPKHKKTLVIMDMCHHIVSGLYWMTTPKGSDGIEVASERVVWIDLENGTQVLKRRMKAFARALEIDIDHGQFQAYSMPSPWPDFSRPENVAAMIERIKGLGDIGVLVIDHLGQVFGPVDENSPLASQIMGAIRQISEACNVAIILVHHAKKGIGKAGGAPEDNLRGSGSILAGVDGAFLVERDMADKDQVTIKPVAVRGPDAPNISANFSYTQDENLDLTEARFWRIAYRSKTARAHDAIIEALKQNDKLNHTQLRAEAKRIDKSLSDANIREGIEILHGTREIIFVSAAKGAKIYELAGDSDEDD